MLEKSALETNSFDVWSVYHGKHYFSLSYENVKGMLKHAEYKVLDEEIDAKIQEKIALKEEIED